MASPSFGINGGDPGVKASVSPASAIHAELDSLDGVDFVEWEIGSTDELSDISDYDIVTSGATNEIADTTSLGLGTAGILKCTINHGRDPRTGNISSAMTATCKFFVPTATGLEIGAANEQFESNATSGSTGITNAAVRAVDSAIAAAAASRVPVKWASTTNHTLSGAATDDGSAWSVADRVLLKDQTDPSQNGIWVRNSGAWTRATDADISAELPPGTSVFVQAGSTNKGAEFVLVTAGPISLGTTPLKFLRKSPEIDARVLAAGDGSTDDTSNLQLAANAAGKVRYSKGTYLVAGVSSIGTTGANTHSFDRGSIITIPGGSSPVITINGQIGAPSDQQIFDVQPGATLHLPDVAEVHVGWFGTGHVGINSAASAITGGRIRVDAGTHTLADHVLLNENRSLIGAGVGATILTLSEIDNEDEGAQFPSIKIGTEAGFVDLPTGQVLSDLTIGTDDESTEYAVLLEASTNNTTFLSGVAINRVAFKHCAAGCLKTPTGVYTTDIDIQNVKVQECNEDGPGARALFDFLDANGTTVNLRDVYFSNNRHATDGLCIRIGTDAIHLDNLIVESSGRLIVMSGNASLLWTGGRCEDMYGPIVNSTQSDPSVWGGNVDIHGVYFERGPLDLGTPVVIVAGAGLSSVRINGCTFASFGALDRVLINVSCEEDQIDLSGCTFTDCAPEFIAQFGKRRVDQIVSRTNLALHSAFEDSDHASASGGSTGITHGRDTTHRLDQDTASQSITFAAGAVGSAELDNTAIGISGGVTDDVLISFVAWLSTGAKMTGRALWSGTEDLSNWRLDATATKKRYLFRATSPLAGYTAGTYALFFEAPAPALAGTVILNVAEVEVYRVPRGAPFAGPGQYIDTIAASRTVAGGNFAVGGIENAIGTTLPLYVRGVKVMDVSNPTSTDAKLASPTAIHLEGSSVSFEKSGVGSFVGVSYDGSNTVIASLAASLNLTSAGSVKLLPANGSRFVLHTDTTGHFGVEGTSALSSSRRAVSLLYQALLDSTAAPSGNDCLFLGPAAAAPAAATPPVGGAQIWHESDGSIYAMSEGLSGTGTGVQTALAPIARARATLGSVKKYAIEETYPTSSNTGEDIVSFTMPSTSRARARAHVTATDPATGDTASWELRGQFRRQAGTYSIVGQSGNGAPEFSQGTVTGLALGFVSSPSICLFGVGIAAATVKWETYIEIEEWL